MKHTYKKMIAIILAVLVIAMTGILLTGCGEGQKDTEPTAATTAETVNETTAAAEEQTDSAAQTSDGNGAQSGDNSSATGDRYRECQVAGRFRRSDHQLRKRPHTRRLGGMDHCRCSGDDLRRSRDRDLLFGLSVLLSRRQRGMTDSS